MPSAVAISQITLDADGGDLARRQPGQHVLPAVGCCLRSAARPRGWPPTARHPRRWPRHTAASPMWAGPGVRTSRPSSWLCHTSCRLTAATCAPRAATISNSFSPPRGPPCQRLSPVLARQQAVLRGGVPAVAKGHGEARPLNAVHTRIGGCGLGGTILPFTLCTTSRLRRGAFVHHIAARRPTPAGRVIQIHSAVGGRHQLSRRRLGQVEDLHSLQSFPNCIHSPAR